MITHCSLYAGLFVFLSPILCASQRPDWVLDGRTNQDRFGQAVAAAGDVDGDLTPDIVVGAWADDLGGNESGAVYVYSGATMQLLYEFLGPASGARMGWSVAGAGDVNGDGFADILAGMPEENSNGTQAGAARLFSGQDGSVLVTLYGDQAGEAFGWSVAGAGDVNADGYADFLIGAPLADVSGKSFAGYARVYSGATGSILYEVSGSAAAAELGTAVAGNLHADGDAFPDFAVGAPAPLSAISGYVEVVSGSNGSLIQTLQAGDNGGFAKALAGASDMDGDGLDEIVVGAPNSGFFGPGSARVYTLPGGSLLHTVGGDAQVGSFGAAVAGGGDLNGDGRADFLIGAQDDGREAFGAGSVRSFEGREAGVLNTLVGRDAGDAFGVSVAVLGDLNSDQRADFAVGRPRIGLGASGSVEIYLSRRQPFLEVPPLMSGQIVTLRALKCQPLATVHFLVSFAGFGRIALPSGPLSISLSDPITEFHLTQSDANGMASWAGFIPAKGIGYQAHLQVMESKNGSFSVSQVVRKTIQ